MKKRLFWFSLSALSLCIGGLLYGLCRTDTYVGKVVATVLTVRISADVALYSFLAWYFPDYLWMFSLACTLFGVVLPKRRDILIWCAVACAWGVLWEVAQRIGVVTGTGDFRDVFMYIMAVVTAALINNLKRGK